MIRTGSALVFGAVLVSTQACTAVPDRSATSTVLLVASQDSRVGGEAYYEGTLRVENGCVVVGSSGSVAVPIFDPSVRLLDTGNELIDEATGRRFRFGIRIRASAAWLRDNGRGWSPADIDTVVGSTVPAQCNRHTVLRLAELQFVQR